MNNLRFVKSCSRFVIFAIITNFLFSLAISLIGGLFLAEHEKGLEIYSLVTSYIPVLIAYYYGYLIFFKQYQVDIKNDFSVSKKKTFDVIYDLIGCWFIIIIANLFWNFILNLIVPEPPELDYGPMIFQIIVICILAPIFEEIMFRGFILKVLKENYNAVIAVIISALLFSLFHTALHQIFPTFIMGLLFGMLYVKYKSLIPCILLHMFNNFLSVYEVPLFDTSTLVIVMYVVMFVLSIIFLYEYFNKKKIKLFKNIKESIVLSFQSVSFLLLVIINIVVIVLTIKGKM